MEFKLFDNSQQLFPIKLIDFKSRILCQNRAGKGKLRVPNKGLRRDNLNYQIVAKEGS